MNTLVIVSHPDVEDSASQQYLLRAIEHEPTVTIHVLEQAYPNGEIDIQKEQELLQKHHRIVFQFPLYWYSTPPLLKKWQDEVLTDTFAFGGIASPPQLKGKEFLLVSVIGAKKEEYQTGGREGFSLDALMTPFQALAHKTQMQYKRPLYIHQFAYLSEKEKMCMLIAYQQVLTMKQPFSLAAREEWMVERLQTTDKKTLDEAGKRAVEEAIVTLEHNRDTLDELQLMLDELNG